MQFRAVENKTKNLKLHSNLGTTTTSTKVVVNQKVVAGLRKVVTSFSWIGDSVFVIKMFWLFYQLSLEM